MPSETKLGCPPPPSEAYRFFVVFFSSPSAFTQNATFHFSVKESMTCMDQLLGGGWGRRGVFRWTTLRNRTQTVNPTASQWRSGEVGGAAAHVGSGRRRRRNAASPEGDTKKINRFLETVAADLHLGFSSGKAALNSSKWTPAKPLRSAFVGSGQCRPRDQSYVTCNIEKVFVPRVILKS